MPIAMIALTTPAPEHRREHDREQQGGKGEGEVAKIHDHAPRRARRAEAAAKAERRRRCARPMPTAMTPTRIEMRAPARSCETMSCPERIGAEPMGGEGWSNLCGTSMARRRVRRPYQRQAPRRGSAAPPERRRTRNWRCGAPARRKLSLAHVIGACAGADRSPRRRDRRGSSRRSRRPTSSITQFSTTSRSRLAID